MFCHFRADFRPVIEAIKAAEGRSVRLSVTIMPQGYINATADPCAVARTQANHKLLKFFLYFFNKM